MDKMGQSRSSLVYKINTRTRTPTLAVGIETGDADTIEVVGGESGVGDQEKSGEES